MLRCADKAEADEIECPCRRLGDARDKPVDERKVGRDPGVAGKFAACLVGVDPVPVGRRGSVKFELREVVAVSTSIPPLWPSALAVRSPLEMSPCSIVPFVSL